MNRRIAVVSPFLDKHHGTERCIAEQLERLSHDYEFHVYSSHVEEVDPSRIQWHQIPDVPGPLLFRYVWWFIANRVSRWWNVRFRGIQYDLVYSPGINCLDADIIAVHIVFAEFYRLVRHQMILRRNPVHFWPRLMHRWLYYRLLIFLEHLVYTDAATLLVPISRKVADDLKCWYGRSEVLPIVYNGVDSERFSPETRGRLRAMCRQSLKLDQESFAILLIGNDWKKKGLSCLLSAVQQLENPNLRVLIVGQDDATPYRGILDRAGLSQNVSFLPVRPDVEFYYAAADAYVGPSLEDAFSLPPLEAMACGLPVIVSRRAGVSEIITQEFDGFVLENPQQAMALANMLERLCNIPELCRQVGERATQTAKQYTWERNAAEMKAQIDLALRQRRAKESELGRAKT